MASRLAALKRHIAENEARLTQIVEEKRKKSGAPESSGSRATLNKTSAHLSSGGAASGSGQLMLRDEEPAVIEVPDEGPQQQTSEPPQSSRQSKGKEVAAPIPSKRKRRRIGELDVELSAGEGSSTSSSESEGADEAGRLEAYRKNMDAYNKLRMDRRRRLRRPPFAEPKGTVLISDFKPTSQSSLFNTKIEQTSFGLYEQALLPRDLSCLVGTPMLKIEEHFAHHQMKALTFARAMAMTGALKEEENKTRLDEIQELKAEAKVAEDNLQNALKRIEKQDDEKKTQTELLKNLEVREVETAKKIKEMEVELDVLREKSNKAFEAGKSKGINEYLASDEHRQALEILRSNAVKDFKETDEFKDLESTSFMAGFEACKRLFISFNGVAPDFDLSQINIANVPDEDGGEEPSFDPSILDDPVSAPDP